VFQAITSLLLRGPDKEELQVSMLGKYPANQMASSRTFLFIQINISLNKKNIIEEKNLRVTMRGTYSRVSIILAPMRHQRLWVEGNSQWEE